MAVLDDVKLLLDITDTDTDAKLNIIISHASKQILSYMPQGVNAVPDALSYIVAELTVTRFNRIGNEGMSSYSQDGESISYTDSDIAPYMNDIKAYLKTQEGATSGIVRFL